MDAREHWQALHARLRAARTRLEAGDRRAALAEVDAALAIDPDFLAAHSLRERIVSSTGSPRPAETGLPQPPPPSPPPAAPVRTPLAQPEGYAHFEQRARRRRTDRKLDAARTALRRRRLKAAAAALDEIIELDPNLPQLAALTVEFDELRRAQAQPHKGRRFLAVVAFASVAFTATRVSDLPSLRSRSISSALPAVDAAPPRPAADAAPPRPAEPSPLPVEPAPAGPVATVGTASRAAPFEPRLEPAGPQPESRLEPPARPQPEPPPEPLPVVIATPSPEPPSPSHPSSAADSQEPPPETQVVPPPVAENRVVAPVTTSDVPRAEARPVAPDDQALIQQALQRYRRAYNGLDAHSAAQVWPAVNEAALARAFEGLESQTLTFDACDVQLLGDGVASARCRGSARYVPKIGSRQPRVEPRTWTFDLRRATTGWRIRSARVDQ